MWHLVDRMMIEKDNFQVFELTIQDGAQHIKYFHEQPKWSEKVVLLTNNPITEKEYIIKDEGLDGEIIETLLLAENYY